MTKYSTKETIRDVEVLKVWPEWEAVTSAGLKGTAGANRVRTVWYEITIRTAVPHWKERGKKCSSIFLLPAYLHLLPSVGRTQPKGRRQENLGFSLIDHKKDGE